MNNEIFISVIDYEDLYEVSNMGRIRSLPRVVPNGKGGTMIRKSKFIGTNIYHPSGYYFVMLIRNKVRKGHAVHRIVAKAFVDNPNKYNVVNHIDCIKSNNCASNLEWCTPAYNSKHATENGLMKPVKGENHGMSKLTDKIVLKIRELAKYSKHNNREIGDMFGLTRHHVGFIVRRKIWNHI